MTFLGWFVPAQLLLLLPVITGQYRGIPLAVVILGVLAALAHILCQPRSVATCMPPVATKKLLSFPACRSSAR